jgi:hypothetical protein
VEDEDGTPARRLRQTAQVPLAFLVMAHRNPRQVGRLLRAIHRPGDTCLVHVDRKAPADVHRAVHAEVESLPGVSVLPSSAIRWGGWSIVEVQLRAIRQLIDTTQDWSHFINLSGQDFPLVPTPAIDAQLSTQPSRSYLQYFRPEEMPWTWQNPAFKPGKADFDRPASRIDRFYIEWPGPLGIRPLPRIRRRLPDGITWYGGSQWMALSRETCVYLTHSRAAQRLRRFYRHTFIPDESFFQTALLNSPLRETVVNNNKRAIQWEPNVVTYTLEHRDSLLSSDAWYARKFDDDIDPEILDLLEQRLFPSG